MAGLVLQNTERYVLIDIASTESLERLPSHMASLEVTIHLVQCVKNDLPIGHGEGCLCCSCTRTFTAATVSAQCFIHYLT